LRGAAGIHGSVRAFRAFASFAATAGCPVLRCAFVQWLPLSNGERRDGARSAVNANTACAIAYFAEAEPVAMAGEVSS